MKKRLIAITLCLLLLPLQVSAQTAETIGRITVKQTHHADAEYLRGTVFYQPVEVYAYEGDDPEKVLRTPKTHVVYDTIIDTLSKLETAGVNVDGLTNRKLNIEIVNVLVRGIAGHAFIQQPVPTIYLYGGYNSSIETEKNHRMTTIHEFGHFIDLHFIKYQDRQKYREIRGITNSMGNEQYLSWKERAVEIFAEDFKTIIDPTYPNRGALGEPTPEQLEQIKQLIIDVLNRELPKREYLTPTMKYIIDNKTTYGVTDLLHSQLYDQFMSQPLTTRTMIEYLDSYLQSKHGDFHKQDKNDIYFNFTHYNQSTRNFHNIHTKDVAKALEYFTYVGQQQAKVVEEDTWGSKIDVGNTPVKSIPEIDRVQLTFKARGIDTKDLTLSDTVTRQEAAYWLYKNLELDKQPKTNNNIEFKDVPKNHPYSDAIQELANLNIIRGINSTHFGWDTPITREQMASIIVRAYNFQPHINSTFKDNKNISQNFTRDVDALFSQEVIKGNNGYFYPKSTITYREYLLMLHRSFLSNTVEFDNSSIHTTLEGLKTLLNTANTPEDIWTKGDFFTFMFENTEIRVPKSRYEQD